MAAVAAVAETAVAAEIQSPAMDMGLIRKAMAFRLKYRVSDRKTRMSLRRMGVHPQNRGGMYQQPDTVCNLGLKIMATGLNESEANHEGVSV